MAEHTTRPENTTEEPPTRPTTTGAEAVVAALEAANVQHAFGVQGGAIMPVYDALYHADIRHVTMGHEQSAAHAAAAYGVVAGEPGVCLATSGPGATNLVTGLADADMDSDPVLALTGQAPSHLMGKDAFQEVDTRGMTDPVTKANYLAADADTVGTTVGEAYAMARDGRPGPTLVDLPKDITLADADGSSGDTDGPAGVGGPPTADGEAVTAAADALAGAERPVVLSGGGVIKGEAAGELRQFAGTYGVPVVTTMPGIGSFPEDHDLAMHVAGMHGTGYANLALQHCDVLLAVGTRFDDRLTGAVERFAPGAEVIHVDVDPAEISKTVHADYPLVGDAAAVLDQLTDALHSPPDAAAWRERCRRWKSTYTMEYSAPADEPLKPQFVVEAMDALTPDDTVVTTGVGQHQMWAMQYWTYRHPRTWVSSHGLGTMGYGLPAAIGARFAADDDRSVVCFDGDGSFLMTLQELAVAVREDLDITVVVLNNAAVGMVRQWQDAFFDGRRMASAYPWVPAFDVLAEAFGARGFCLEADDEVDETLRAALDYDGPAVVDAHIDPEENVYPLVPGGGDNTNFAMNDAQLADL
ncbi:biosynthetic-type acetolactate synthase large subunit [Haloplanus rubicundus]|uniref:Acetolactate synthase n=1 Tax=Haloplanus rubicundus TaxID=1547898 RepID=A0A345E1G4_9EURY|nr:biosynthetic-type acetolactate synthase large subunit [Haloplanus rubicundus]AXG06036.1 biosynthetic-type acetolactate synthase large subunit [Haloplanus rubicundus]